MLRMQVINYLRRTPLSRRFSTSLLKQENKTTNNPKSASDTTTQSIIGGPSYHPTEFDKTVLIWTKRYRSREEIPRLVTTSVITESRSKARIKVCNYLILLTAIIAMYNIYSGRNLGFVQEQRTDGIDYHKQISQDYRESLKNEQKKA